MKIKHIVFFRFKNETKDKYEIKHDVLKHKYENKTCCVFYIQDETQI